VPQSGLWLRIFIGLLVAVMPPILMVVGALLVTNSVLSELNAGLVAIVVVIGAVGWAAVLAIVFGRSLDEDFRSLVALARRGDQAQGPEAGATYQELAGLLDERNRQVAALARQASDVPIDDAPRAVVASLVSAVRSVMRDPTWRLAVLSSTNDELLPPGVYHAAEDDLVADPLGDLERWAAVSGAGASARLVEGPWGAFTVIEVASSDRLRAILYAPWEGRSQPSPAEIDLDTLVGQHAGTAIEHSLLYAQVRSQADELNRLAAVQADFLRGVTHDLQTPLTSIGALATELGADRTLSSDAQRDLSSITHQAERLRRMVSQLLVASRLEAGALVPRQDVFAVRPLVERTWAALRADRRFALSVDGADYLAVGDPDRLEQVLWAVLDNAVKYSPDGSPIDVEIRPDGNELSLTIHDRGMGMDAATAAHAFEQFYRSDQARRSAPDGSGVGLYAARGLMQAMGGTIEVDSQMGSGTTVVLRIPAEPAMSANE
jgi:signal transduction histidine kinase